MSGALKQSGQVNIEQLPKVERYILDSRDFESALDLRDGGIALASPSNCSININAEPSGGEQSTVKSTAE